MNRIIGILASILVLASLPDVGESFGKFGKLKSLVRGSDVDNLLKRIEKIKNNFTGTTNCLRTSRDLLFDIAANKEKKEQLMAKEAAISAAETEADKDRITIEIQQMKDEEIERARKSGELEKKKLNEKQLKNSGKLGYNLLLAILKDKAAINDGKKIKSDGKLALNRIKKDKMAAVKAGTKINDLATALRNDIPMIITEAPRQIKTLQAFLSANSALRKSNKIEDLGKPKADDEFQELDF